VIRRRRFGDVIERQLDLFERDHGELLEACEEALRAYRAAPREEAEESYERFGDLQAEANEALEDARNAYAATLDDEVADRYLEEFDRTAAKRFRHIWIAEEAL
jgi:hypothetical protein